MIFGIPIAGSIFFSAHFIAAWLLGVRGLELLGFYPSSSGSFARRFAVRIAGPLAIYLFAAVLFAAHHRLAGPMSSRVSPVEDLPADLAGVLDGDVVVETNGHPVKTFEDLAHDIRASAGRDVQLTIQRDGKPTVLTVTPRTDGTIGLRPFGEVITPTIMAAVGHGLSGPPRAISEQTQVVFRIALGNIRPAPVGGPIAIRAERDHRWMLAFIAMSCSCAWPIYVAYAVLFGAIGEMGALLVRRPSRTATIDQ